MQPPTFRHCHNRHPSGVGAPAGDSHWSTTKVTRKIIWSQLPRGAQFKAGRGPNVPNPLGGDKVIGNRFIVMAITILAIAALLLSACGLNQAPAVKPTQAPGSEPTKASASEPTVPSEPSVPPASKNLVVCVGEEPSTLYLYGGSTPVASHIQQAIYDGPIDNNTFAYQPVILAKLPSLAGGDAVIQVVDVKAGDRVVDTDGNVVELGDTILFNLSFI